MNDSDRTGDLHAFRLDLGESGSVHPADYYRALVARYCTVVEWYLVHKRSKQKISKYLRFSSLIIGVTGGVVPLASPIFPQLDSALGYLLLAIAGGFQLVDRYFGYSVSWSRYVATAMMCNRGLLNLQAEWASSEDADQTARWSILRRYSADLGRVIAEETSVWVDEFESVREIAEVSVDRTVGSA
ncbi:SLATT domain-containing protein [Kribbella sp. NPDC004536]|uniref:SLATT domain-containing protein n=1 Tax=Kribbella sp. NPDC004536 TaxID=3364106 RepID=UPI00367B1694